ncbi:MAG: FAD-dependent oxidoreductase [Alphaproteobacteria bacterium]|nr:FAD-dependent oxidoreductase [Alphaproteobacteria bacterium]
MSAAPAQAQAKKPGVYLCGGCGIAQATPLDALEKVASKEYKVAHCRKHDFLCGEAGVKLIRDDIAAGTVNQPVIAACSSRVNADRFRFDGAQVIRANLREQVAWTQEPGSEDAAMAAADYLRMALTEARKSSPPVAYDIAPYSERVLVVGGGISGLTAAREAAEAGYQVLLVEREAKLGGQSLAWSKRMPHLPPYREPRANDIEALVKAVESHPAIEVRRECRVVKTSGGPGKFAVELSQGGAAREEAIGAIVVATGWRPYDPNKLGHLGYGATPDVVTGVALEGMLAKGPLVRPSDGRAAKLVAFVQCAGSRDPAHLPYCSSVCCGVSIKQALQIRQSDPDSSVYIVYDELRTPGTAEEFYRAAQEAGVVFVKGKVKGVGADLTVTYDDALLGQSVPMQGLDLVVLATGMVPNATELGDSGEAAPLPPADINPLSPIPVAGYAAEAPAAQAAAPAAAATQGASLLNLQYRQGPHLPILADGFADSHFICFPYETRRSGIYACGPLRRPMDMAESAEDATGAALKAIQAIRNVVEGRGLHPRSGDLSFPKIGLTTCTKCRRCTVECPFGAIDENEQGQPVVNPSRCRRCGTCMGACPVRTISFDNYSVEMLTSMIKAVEIPDEDAEKPRVLVLACQNDAVPALDMAGIARSRLNPYVRIVPVRCLGSVSLVCVSEALSSGYDGIVLMGCKSGDDYQCHFVKGSAMAQERLQKVGETLKSMALEKERVRPMEVSIADAARLPKLLDDYLAEIDKIGPSPLKGFG